MDERPDQPTEPAAPTITPAQLGEAVPGSVWKRRWLILKLILGYNAITIWGLVSLDLAIGRESRIKEMVIDWSYVMAIMAFLTYCGFSTAEDVMRSTKIAGLLSKVGINFGKKEG